MKQEIIEKLYSNVELTGDELVYIARNLQDGEPSLPFCHEKENMAEACGLSRGDASECADKLTKALGEDAALTSVSQAVEKLEVICMQDPKLLRVVLFHTLASSPKRRVISMEAGDTDKEIQDLIKRLIKRKLGDNDGNKE